MKALKALKEYFTLSIVLTWVIILLACSLALSGDAAAFILCWVLLELRDIKELLEDK